MRKAAAKKD
uniref:Macaca fascicularis brain cDNA clone: QmoA-11883, similar to human ribosomal protein L36 (RPL36), transcript variant 1, mRNA, RefSeq: NM_033643.1 n=1 Tax=Macaca fascicularis TaxID=9541 RepID=I7GJV8_MACFA|nr:unnamed protein product [Macaca fascicularis]